MNQMLPRIEVMPLRVFFWDWRDSYENSDARQPKGPDAINMPKSAFPGNSASGSLGR
jgi:hypothetical protein